LDLWQAANRPKGDLFRRHALAEEFTFFFSSARALKLPTLEILGCHPEGVDLGLNGVLDSRAVASGHGECQRNPAPPGPVGLEARDRRVFDWSWRRRIPLAFAMAGGYGTRIEDTVQAQVSLRRPSRSPSCGSAPAR